MQNALSPSISVEIQPGGASVTVSTLLIPDSYVSVLDDILKRRACRLGPYLKYLLIEYRSAVLAKNLPVSEKCKRLYQDAGQDLQRRNFRPDNESWLELGMLARSLGISRCCLFIRLLLLDKKKHEKNAVPTFNSGTGISVRFVIKFEDTLNIEGNHYKRTLSRSLGTPGRPPTPQSSPPHSEHWLDIPHATCINKPDHPNGRKSEN